jgi:hypothetical protein
LNPDNVSTPAPPGRSTHYATFTEVLDAAGWLSEEGLGYLIGGCAGVWIYSCATPNGQA